MRALENNQNYNQNENRIETECILNEYQTKIRLVIRIVTEYALDTNPFLIVWRNRIQSGYIQISTPILILFL